MQPILKSMLFFALLTLLVSACGNSTDSGADGGPDADTDAGPEEDAGTDSGTNPECSSLENCCTATGTWRTDCDHGCDPASGTCWAECNPSLSCCNADGTSCAHGCDGDSCYADCDPEGGCCEDDGTWTPSDVQQPGTNLYWQRCAIGQSWQEGESCGCSDGLRSSMDWCTASGIDASNCDPTNPGTDICAHTYPSTDWRLPSAEEFSVLLEESTLGDYDGQACDGNDGDTVCTGMFGPQDGDYWSTTPTAATMAWFANFATGGVSGIAKDASRFARCVRTEP